MAGFSFLSVLAKEKVKRFLKPTLVIVLGFILRIILVDKVIGGDLLAFAEWGQKIWELPIKDFYFGSYNWFYSVPNHTPISYFIFGTAYWLFEHKYVLAQLHNLIRFPPAAFIIYFYKYGYIFLLKLPSILSDLGLGLIIYYLINKFTKDRKKALWGLTIFVLNPITIFISGAWGQTDSIVSFLGLASFILLSQGKVGISAPLLFLSLYIKPSWSIFFPLYVFVLFKVRPTLGQIVSGILICTAIFIVSTYNLSGGNLIGFSFKVFKERLVIPTRDVGKASISAFNFYTIFFKIDKDLPSVKFITVSARNVGLLVLIFLNLVAFRYFKNKDKYLLATLFGIYTIGFGGFLFLPNMLERYFFPALSSMVVLAFVDLRILKYVLLTNLILAANVFWSFYRRSSDEINHFFINYNYFVIRFFSLNQIFLYVLTLLQFKRGRVKSGASRSDFRDFLRDR